MNSKRSALIHKNRVNQCTEENPRLHLKYVFELYLCKKSILENDLKSSSQCKSISFKYILYISVELML